LTIQGTGTDERVTVDVPIGVSVARFVIEDDLHLTSVTLTVESLGALECAVRAARLELEARAKVREAAGVET
jgi:citrate lyase gamma subunit